MKFEIQERAMPPYLLACLIRGRGVRAEHKQEGPRSWLASGGKSACGVRPASTPDCGCGSAAFVRAVAGVLLLRGAAVGHRPCGAAAGRVGPYEGAPRRAAEELAEDPPSAEDPPRPLRGGAESSCRGSVDVLVRRLLGPGRAPGLTRRGAGVRLGGDAAIDRSHKI
jgi:hypothetical protein